VDVAAIDGYLQARADDDAFSGVVRIERSGNVLLERGYGLASRSWGVPCSPEHRFDTASLTKVFTAVAVLQQVEAGAFSLDTSTTGYLGLEDTTVDPMVASYAGNRRRGQSGVGDDPAVEDLDPPPEPGRVAGVIVGRAIYRNGVRVAEPQDFSDMAAVCREGGGIAWIGLYRPTHEEFAEVAREFDLHELAVEDAVHAHQRAKLERYGATLFCVLRPARYIDETETVEFGEVHVFAGPHFVITVRHSEAPHLAEVRHNLESRPDLLRRGTVAILHAVLDRVIDDYAPVVAGIENDIDEIEDEVFGGSADVSRRVYELTREVIAFQRATKPLAPMLEQLMADPGVDDEERRYVRNVQDHALRLQEHADGFRQLLQNILDVNLTLETKALSEASHKQDEEVKKISAWAAILFAPTLIGTIYGMNFRRMPELHWRLGYPFALGLMLATCLTLYLVFKRRSWI
jgi:magnesium transporter